MSTKVLLQIRLGETHKPTGKTRHFGGGELLSPPAFLQIVQYAEGSGYYLLYLDNQQIEMTDTFHETIKAAQTQAEWEFGVQFSEWEEDP
jgi:hypothetical protein